MKTRQIVGATRSPSSESTEDEGEDDLRRLVLVPPKNRKHLSKQLSMKETSRDAAWERRRHQFVKRQRSFGSAAAFAGKTVAKQARSRSLTDEDLDELKGCLDLGFDFKEEEDHGLKTTLPALDLYFAVKRQLSDSKVTLQHQLSFRSQVSTPDSGTSSPRSPHSDPAAWKICNPGDNPQHVKTRLRHWAQVVACSVRQCC
ncbi:uncharacterized protein LOC116257296 [Nymphaea colorata]|nr:uncharacterized protein LOC116257296 [Nymphaea colorata]